MIRVPRLFLLVAPIVLTGCGGWTRPNTTEAEFRRDSYECSMEAARTYPTLMQSSGGGYQAPDTTNCTRNGNQTNCTTTPGAYTAPPQSDVNAGMRADANIACLRTRGYQYKIRQ